MHSMGRDVPILIPGISNYVTLHDKKNVAHLIKFEIVRLFQII